MDYSEMSSPPADLGIDLDFSALGPMASRPGADLGATRAAGAPVASDEILIDAGRDLLCVNCYHRAGWAGTSPTTWLRRGVVTRLLESVQLDLPDGFGLAVFDGWRSPETVAALYDHFYGPGSTLEPGFLAAPDTAGTPPHLTGGAVDLTLSWRGTPLSLGTPFDEFTPLAHLDAFESVPDDGPAADVLVRDLRRLLHDVMTDAGFAPYPAEWWHWSWGDAAWAEWSGAPAALYGATSPTR